ncbi:MULTISPECIES: phenylacetate--CoA ligase [unclassified Pseudodesulfovibrio]|uniref:phenylacetate--CoA ligase family protein n=1 Tax=unclassified Pseudodesulfovibrio TaxID=2661612 RepID=UPI000FEB7CCC|nr:MULTISPECIES: phenylacetate--CoA ligase [unclassified Pseudodesulfovibrio]MCJ2164600.1 phenylacetate--CoA ligase [Pseudodesulfovibrio sp. S3-i]RWU04206.1 phenylacetate--CoA ligase family protein [Pseudodesulfovibrio sp. S3]
MDHRFIPHLTEEQIADIQLAGLQWTTRHAYANSPFYQARLKETGVEPGDIKTLDDIRKLPFTTADDLKSGYPLPLLAVAESEVVRIHGSSGTTGKRKILAYTQNDIDTWKDMFARCYELAGLTREDRVQICVGYGLWTAGAGFQLGCERFGAMALPVGPGLLEIQLQMLTDLKATCLCSTASMALLMGEEVQKQGLFDQINLKKAIFGAETHTPKMRRQFEEALGLEDSFDIVGMTELYGPGTGLECQAHDGIHYWADMYILEILDPETLEPVAPGEVGEMVVTSLKKEASPLIRYRTHDLTRLIPGRCACGVAMPRMDKIMGRSDDMFIFRGVNIYPGQIGSVLEGFGDLSAEYKIFLTRKDGLDHMAVQVERTPDAATGCSDDLCKALSNEIRKHILVRSEVKILGPGELPRSFAKTKRVEDSRGEE